MAEVTYEAFVAQTDAIGAGAPPVYLVHGDDYRVEEVCESLVAQLVGGGPRDLLVDRLQGGDEAIHQAIDQLNTFALLADRKIVVLPDARFFFGKQNTAAILESARKAFDKDEKRRAALHVLKYLALKGLTPADAETRQVLSADLSKTAEDAKWVDALLGYCREHDLSPPSGDGSPVERLVGALEKGFPKGHVLIITAETVDKRKSIYKTIAEQGTVIDCRVPRGDRAADRKVQAQALADTADRLMSASGKTLAPDARKLLSDRVGCDLRQYAAAVEKLITYTGERNKITAGDVRQLVPRTRQEPIYALTSAVAEGNSAEAVRLLRQMVADEMIHPLQAMAAVANQVRRLIVARQFIDSPASRGWRRDMAYPGFAQQILPALVSWQTQLDDGLAAVMAQSLVPDRSGAPLAQTRKGFPAELKPAKNPKSPFPAYQLLKNAGAFSMDALMDAMDELAAADVVSKSQGGMDTAPLEKVIFAMASPEGRPKP